MRPLEDVRIIAVEQYGAGPWGSLHLADLGAEVIKIEDCRTGGDVGRYVPPFQGGEDSLFFETFNRGKRSLSLDVTNPAGRAVLEALVRVSDAVYSNLRGDVPAKLRLRYDDLKSLNPRIVCCSLSAFGTSGPRSGQPGYDYMLQGLAGWMSLTGEPEGPPTKSGLSLVDYCGGFVAAIALLAGVHAARRDGAGMDCDVSLFDVATVLLSYPATWHLTGGFTPERTRHSAHPSLVPFQNFETADGWIVVACAKEKFWRRLVPLLGREDLAADRRFATFALRREHAAELLAALERAFRARTSAEWLADLEAAGVPCAPVNDVAAALADPQTAARDLIVETEHPRFGTVRQLGAIAKVGAERPAYRRAPRRGEDARAILRKLLGYDDDRVQQLAAAGAFGSPEGAEPGRP
ncbi:MAG TPA: CoA transferase, partial [Actinomycetes bacterium]|nr:CoA transferase [Actinomycetes bacterium]